MRLRNNDNRKELEDLSKHELKEVCTHLGACNVDLKTYEELIKFIEGRGNNWGIGEFLKCGPKIELEGMTPDELEELAEDPAINPLLSALYNKRAREHGEEIEPLDLFEVPEMISKQILCPPPKTMSWYSCYNADNEDREIFARKTDFAVVETYVTATGTDMVRVEAYRIDGEGEATSVREFGSFLGFGENESAAKDTGKYLYDHYDALGILIRH